MPITVGYNLLPKQAGIRIGRAPCFDLPDGRLRPIACQDAVGGDLESDVSMRALRRRVLKGAAGTAVVAVAAMAGLLKPTRVLAAASRESFKAVKVDHVLKAIGASAPVASGKITIQSLDIVENGAIVPLEVISGIAGTSAIAILVENNATPLVASFKLAGGTQGYVSTRIKMAQTGLVRVVVTADNKHYTATKTIDVTFGGCGG